MRLTNFDRDAELWTFAFSFFDFPSKFPFRRRHFTPAHVPARTPEIVLERPLNDLITVLYTIVSFKTTLIH